MKIDKALDKTHEIIKHIVSLTDLPLIVYFSGGKCSSAMLLATLDVTENIECMYANSGMTLPKSLDFVQKQAERLGIKLHVSYPPMSFIGYVRKYHCFPLHMAPWCSKALKIRPARRYLRRIYGFKSLYSLVGVRRNESSRRWYMYDLANRNSTYNPVIDLEKNIVKDSEHSGSFKVFPVLHWTDQNVREFLVKRNFEVNKNYEHFGVADCYYCPFYQETIYKRILRVYPNIYDEIIKLEKELGKPSVAGNKWLSKIKEDVKTETYLTQFA